MSRRKKIAKKVAKKYMSNSLGAALNKHLSEAQIDLSNLEKLTKRALDLVDNSSHREHIYKEAGDMIFLYQNTIENLNKQLSHLAYLINKINLQGASDDLNPAVKERLDKVFGK